MKNMLKVSALSLMAAALLSSGAFAAGQVKATLSGFEEVPALSSPGSGEFSAQVSADAIDYTLSYSGLASGVLFAHIHFGQMGVNGGVSVFLCSNAPAPVPTPTCPITDGTVSGTIEADDVIGPDGQGIMAGGLDELLDAVDAGVTYVNVHTNDFPGGEIRGQIGRGLRR